MKIDKAALKTKLPTFVGYWERRQKAAYNRLPKHLRPPAIWPIGIQVVINAAVFVTLVTLMVNKDEYVTEAGPAITMVLCLLVLIYTVINGVRMRNDYRNIRGQGLAKFNFWLMVAAFIAWPLSVAVFLP